MSSQKRIMLIDDDDRDIELTMEALTEFGSSINVDIKRDGEETIDYFFPENKMEEVDKPDLIILDLKMPLVNGIEVLKKLKSDTEFKIIPIVILTSSKEENDILASYRYGANAYIVKPVDFNKFFDVVQIIGSFWFKVNEIPISETTQTASL
jgi:two-component system response regulator